MTRVILVALLAALAAAASAQTAAAVRVLSGDPWCDRVSAAGQRVACEVREFVVNADALDLESQNGPVTVQTWDRADVLVRARVVGVARQQDQAERLVRSSSVTVRGGVVRAGPPRGGASVSYDVFAPRDTDLNVKTVNGPVEIRGLSGRTRAQAANGPVTLSGLAGDVKARSTNGPVTVRLDGRRWRGSGLDVEAVNGPLAVSVPDDYSADLLTETERGRIRTDGVEVCDPVSIRNGSGEQVAGRLGGGGSTIRLRTTNGPVVLTKR